MKVLNSLIVVMLDNHLWTARKKLRPEDLKTAAGTLPPDTLASLGSKKVCDPKKIAIFSALKKRAERVCESVGVRFIGGYAIPEDRIPDVVSELQCIEAEAAQAKKTFLADYQANIDLWVAENTEWKDIILNAVESAEHVSRQIRFGHQAFRIGAVDEDKTEANEGLENSLSGLGDRLIFEVSRDARKLWENSLQGRDQVTQKALRPVRTILEKLRGLSFLDTRIKPMIQRIEQSLSSLPSKGAIADKDFDLLAGLVLQLADPKGMQITVGSVAPTVPAQEVCEEEEIAIDSPSEPETIESQVDEEESVEEEIMVIPEPEYQQESQAQVFSLF
jgi:hypothetical protein